MKLNIPENIAEIIPYPPGKPLEELEREYGISNSIKLASNENPWGPSPKAVAAIEKSLQGLHRYPDGSSFYLTEALARWLGAGMDEIVLGNGSNEVIEFLVKTFVRPGDEVITSHPSFLMYQKFVQVRGGRNTVLPLKDMQHDLEAILNTVSEQTRLIFLDNPNNPCGTFFSTKRFDDFLQRLPESVILVLDEAYADFVEQKLRIDILSYIRKSEGIPAVVGLRTFSKAFGLAGLRIGFGLMHRDIADLLHRVRQPFNINLPAQIGALAALSDSDHYNSTLNKTRSGRQWLSEQVRQLGCKPYPSHTNFFLIDVCGDATRLFESMLHKGVIVRSMKAYGYPDFIRITVGTEAENTRFVKSLAESLNELSYV
ncbi:MAG TPA: histidinol-phosphate transaminase [Desulfobulbaceae bacterium]|nr:histidinol-phosphate transaminase [Desulfobulbaceae bacterium]HHD63284.1 histidinol-phosphate transaminase [Desulfobulbaceae bacterium]